VNEGDIGPVGPAGPRGEQGVQGEQGPHGVNSVGPRGEQGPKGLTGQRGAAAAIAPLVEAIGGLRTAIEGLEARADRAQRRVVGIVVAIIIDLLFTGGFALLYISQEQTAAQVADTRNEILCPLYASWLGTYNPNTRAPGLDRATYENVFGQMRAQYQHLQCTTPLVPKPTPTSAPPPTK
jgi:hypothetical protein